jgi:hypothetical protein
MPKNNIKKVVLLLKLTEGIKKGHYTMLKMYQCIIMLFNSQSTVIKDHFKEQVCLHISKQLQLDLMIIEDSKQVEEEQKLKEIMKKNQVQRPLPILLLSQNQKLEEEVQQLQK